MKNLIKKIRNIRNIRNTSAILICKIITGINPVELALNEIKEHEFRNKEIDIQVQEKALEDFLFPNVSEDFRKTTAYSIKYNLDQIQNLYGPEGYGILEVDDMLRMKKIWVEIKSYIAVH